MKLVLALPAQEQAAPAYKFSRFVISNSNTKRGTRTTQSHPFCLVPSLRSGRRRSGDFRIKGMMRELRFCRGRIPERRRQRENRIGRKDDNNYHYYYGNGRRRTVVLVLDIQDPKSRLLVQIRGANSTRVVSNGAT